MTEREMPGNARHWRRRQLLGAALGSAAGAAVLSLGGPGAPAAQAAESEFAVLRQRWIDMQTGGTGYDPVDPAIAPKISDITIGAQNLWNSMTPAGTALWPDLASTTISAHITTCYGRLRSMALAYCTHGSALAGSAALASAIATGLEWMYVHRYNLDTVVYGNWWDWEIGAPGSLTDVCCLMYATLSAARRTKYLAVVNKHSPDPTKLHHLTLPKESTGANRVAMCKVVAIRAIVVESDAKLKAARDALSAVLLYADEKDGMHRDGSYLFHNYIPYNGGYGQDELNKTGEMVHLLDGSTSYKVTDPNRANLIQWIYKGFAPLLYNGAMMDMVRGRGISRSYAQDHVIGHSVLTSIMESADLGTAADELAFKRLVKANLLGDNYRDFFEPQVQAPAVQEANEAQPSIPSIIAARAILDDPQITPAPNVVADYQFTHMDRTVSRRSGHAFGISMHSARIQNYETINNENLLGWHTADGMTYLYNGDLAHYSDAFWPTVDPQRLAGTTVVHGSTSTTRRFSDRYWAGGSVIAGRYSATGMWLHPFAKTLQAKKSWFMFDNEIVALGCDIRSTDGATVETIIDNRKISADGSNAFVVNGTPRPTTLPWSATPSGVSWAHLAGHVPGSDIGYFFPTASNVHCLRETRTGTWKAINNRDKTPTTGRTNNFLTMWFDHGVNPAAGSYAYAILPGYTAAQTQAYAATPAFQVLANTPAVQAVTVPDQGITALNVWTEEGVLVGGVQVNRCASVLVRRTEDTIEVAVSDPTHLNKGIIPVYVSEAVGPLVSRDAGVTVVEYTPKLKLFVSVAGTQGKTLRATFKRTGTPGMPETPPTLNVPTTIIVDNTDPGFATESTNWTSRNATGTPYGTDYLVDAGEGTDPTMWAMWTPYIPKTGRYNVYMRWSAASNRPTAAPVHVAHRNGLDKSHTVNQRANDGVWMFIGQYEFLIGTNHYVKILGSSPGYTVADAVKFVRAA